MEALAQRVLRKAAAKVGGAEALARYLGVPARTLHEWLESQRLPPAEYIHKAADLVLDDKD